MYFFKFLILMLLLLVTQAQAETISCPTVADIKNHQLHQWQPLYKDNEELASDADVWKFIQAITTLKVAWWQPAFLEAAHCDYAGTDSNADKITLAHDAWRPSPSDNWQWITQDKLAACWPSNAPQLGCDFVE